MTASYTIRSREPEDGFEVRVISTIGTIHTMLGFRTKAEAAEWVNQDKVLHGGAGHTTPIFTGN